MILLLLFVFLMLLILAVSIFHMQRTNLSRQTMIIALIPIAMLLSLLFIILFSNVSPSSIPALPISPASVIHLSQTPSPQTTPLQQSHQLNKIIDALIGAGDFAGWANILSSTDPSTLPITSTLFIPTNDAIARTANSTGVFVPDTLLIPYHIVPQRLTFSDLRKYHVSTKLPTLLPTKFIVVTNDSAENFMIDGTRITHPDLYLTGSLSVHGVMDVLDYNVFGDGVLMKDDMLMKNETSNVEKKTEPESGGVEVSFGGFLGCDFWIRAVAVYVVAVYFIGREFSTSPGYWRGLGFLLMLAYMTYTM